MNKKLLVILSLSLISATALKAGLEDSFIQVGVSKDRAGKVAGDITQLVDIGNAIATRKIPLSVKNIQTYAANVKTSSDAKNKIGNVLDIVSSLIEIIEAIQVFANKSGSTVTDIGKLIQNNATITAGNSILNTSDSINKNLIQIKKLLQDVQADIKNS